MVVAAEVVVAELPEVEQVKQEQKTLVVAEVVLLIGQEQSSPVEMVVKV